MGSRYGRRPNPTPNPRKRGLTLWPQPGPKKERETGEKRACAAFLLLLLLPLSRCLDTTLVVAALRAANIELDYPSLPSPTFLELEEPVVVQLNEKLVHVHAAPRTHHLLCPPTAIGL